MKLKNNTKTTLHLENNQMIPPATEFESDDKALLKISGVAEIKPVRKSRAKSKVVATTNESN